MSLATASLFEDSSSKKSHNNSNRITVLILGGVLLALLFAISSFALAPSAELLDGDDLPLSEISSTNWIINQFLTVSLPLGLELGILITIMRLEYARSHIGEKRPSNQIVKSSNASFRMFLYETARLYCAVFLLVLHPCPE